MPVVFFCFIAQLSIVHSEMVLKFACDPKPYNFDTGRVKCLKYFYADTLDQANMKTLVARRRQCSDFGTLLAMPRDLEQIDFIYRIHNRRPERTQYKWQEYIMVDAYENGASDEHNFRWFDGVLLDTNLWGSGQPSNEEGKQKCVAILHREPKLNDEFCKSSPHLRRTACELCIPEQRDISTCNDICVPNSGKPVCRPVGSECPANQMLFQRRENGTMCDLQPCSSFRYGPKCEKQCFCKDFAACHIVTGQCPTVACEPGWTGKACNMTACPAPINYGPNCDLICKCSNGQACLHCGRCALGCETGLRGFYCSDFAYGTVDIYQDGVHSTTNTCPASFCHETCKEKCGACNGDGSCTQVDCICPSGCKSGWSGTSCTYSGCPRGTWGETCENYCICRDKKSCDADTGECVNGCEPGWRGISCNVSCAQIGKWGSKCTEICSCGSNISCNMRNGNCPSFYIDLETGVCPDPKMWGIYCENVCENKLCTICDRNSRGRKCASSSPCLYGQRWYLGACIKKECPKYFFGGQCSKRCSFNCDGDGTCDSNTGECVHGCRQGYGGPICTDKLDENDFGGAAFFHMLAFGLLGMLLTVIVLTVVIASFLRRKHTEPVKPSEVPDAPHQTPPRYMESVLNNVLDMETNGAEDLESSVDAPSSFRFRSSFGTEGVEEMLNKAY